MQATNVGQALDEGGVGGPYTIFIPSNEALDNMKTGIMDYLLSPEVEYPPPDAPHYVHAGILWTTNK